MVSALSEIENQGKPHALYITLALNGIMYGTPIHKDLVCVKHYIHCLSITIVCTIGKVALLYCSPKNVSSTHHDFLVTKQN